MSLDPASVLLTGRVAIVTGAGGGIGRATALALASFGAAVAACDRDADGLAATADQLGDGAGTGDVVVHRVMDVRDGDAVKAFVDEVARRYGRVDVLVNNAGGTFF